MMSTDYYKVCPECLAHKEHYHIDEVSPDPVAHTWYGGVGKGTQVALYVDMPNETVLIPEGLMATPANFMTVAQLKSKLGAGA